MVLSSVGNLFPFLSGISPTGYLGPSPNRQVLTTGPHPGKGLSQRGPTAPALEDGKGKMLL